MEEIVLREAMGADAAAILAVQRAANEPYRHRPNGPAGAFNDTVEGKRTVMATVPVVLAVAGDMIVGCLFYAREEDHCYLSNLAVLPAYQRRGIGRALVTYAETQARAMGLTVTRLGVRRAMPENRGYYERLGYRVIAETATDFTMEKRQDTTA